MILRRAGSTKLPRERRRSGKEQGLLAPDRDRARCAAARPNSWRLDALGDAGVKTDAA